MFDYKALVACEKLSFEQAMEVVVQQNHNESHPEPRHVEPDANLFSDQV